MSRRSPGRCFEQAEEIRMAQVVEPEKELRDRISARRALAHIEHLVSLGDRFVGSAGDRRGAEYVRAKFGEWGFEVEDREFSTFGYQHSRAELRLIRSSRVFDGIPPYFAPPTPEGGVRGELVFARGGEEHDYERLDVDGKIVLIQETGLGYARFWLGTFAAMAASRGATAMVVVHPLPWPYRMSMEAGNGHLENRFLDVQLPALSVSSIDGAQLMYAIGRGDAEVELVVESSMPEVSSSNVSGILRGKERPDERVVVHAHRDHGLHPGANDNGSGFGTMMEVARALRGTEPRRSIEFLCTTAEEGSTVGAAAYVEAQRREGRLSEIRAAIDLDMFGTGGKLKLVEVGLWPDMDPIPHTEWLMRWVEGIANDLGYDLGRMTAAWGVAESARFLEAGVPAIWFWKPDDFYYHSPHDTLENIDGNSLKAVGDITATVAWQLAEADDLPREP
jgi:aminopeptidase YwaD